jgi:hypothetical protein
MIEQIGGRFNSLRKVGHLVISPVGVPLEFRRPKVARRLPLLCLGWVREREKALLVIW